MIIQRIDECADNALSAYTLFLGSLTGGFARVLDTPRPDSASARHNFILHIVSVMQSAFPTLVKPIEAEALALQRVACDAVKAGAVNFPALDELMTEARSDMMQTLLTVMERDRLSVERELRMFALQVASLQGQGIGYVNALIRARYTRISTLKFEQVDRAGRRWASKNYVRTLIRHTLLRTYVESYLFAWAQQGQDLAEVLQEDGHKHAGLVFSITGATESYPTYESIRDEVFHPNSTALVKGR